MRVLEELSQRENLSKIDMGVAGIQIKQELSLD
jgi:hypothetical protein